MSPEKLSRAEQLSRAEKLREYVRGEIEQFRAGEIGELSSYQKLQEFFRYPRISNVRRLLFTSGLHHLRHQLLSENMRQELSLIPSRRLAWLLGLVSGGGYVADTNLRVCSREEEVVEAFISTTEGLFGINVSKSGKDVYFCSGPIARAIGNLKSDSWSQTLMNKHNWVQGNPDYIWGFLEGYFERNGSVSTYQIELHTVSLNSAICLGDLLYRGGIKYPQLIYNRAQREGIGGTRICGIKDRKFFAERVYSVVSEKEAKLEDIRNLIPDHNIPSSEEEVIQEWLRLYKIRQCEPTCDWIRAFRKEGKTPFGSGVYSNYFGRDGDKRSFVLATQRLREITGVGKADTTE